MYSRGKYLAYLLCRVSHGDEPVGDVGKVQVVSVPLVAVLLLGHHGLDRGRHVADQARRRLTHGYRLDKLDPVS